MTFFVPGVPVPGGSKRLFRNPHSGRLVAVDSSGARGKHWRAAVQLAASTAMGPLTPLGGPLVVELVFVLPRPKAHTRPDGTVRDRFAPALPTVRPDVDKLSRAVLDAGRAVLWQDDAQIVTKLARKVYGAIPGAHITVRRQDGPHMPLPSLLRHARAEPLASGLPATPDGSERV